MQLTGVPASLTPSFPRLRESIFAGKKVDARLRAQDAGGNDEPVMSWRVGLADETNPSQKPG